MNANLNDFLLRWYLSFYKKKKSKVTSFLSKLKFLISTFFITILIGFIFILLWILIPVNILINIIYITYKKIKTAKFKYYTKEDKFKSENENDGKLKIVLDLDNTLIYSSAKKIDRLKNGKIIDNKYYVYKRPYLDIFLQTLSEFCDLALYTSATKEYADKILAFIDKKNLIHERFYRHNCVFSNNRYFKDINILGLKTKVLIIDDNPQCYMNKRDNIIKIKFWNGDEKDDSLLKIKNIIRSQNSRRFAIREIINSSWISEV